MKDQKNYNNENMEHLNNMLPMGDEEMKEAQEFLNSIKDIITDNIVNSNGGNKIVSASAKVFSVNGKP